MGGLGGAAAAAEDVREEEEEEEELPPPIAGTALRCTFFPCTYGFLASDRLPCEATYVLHLCKGLCTGLWEA